MVWLGRSMTRPLVSPSPHRLMRTGIVPMVSG
jgi:hypothetical protein